MSAHHAEPMSAVYDLREAAVEHGKALAEAGAEATPEARDRLITTTIELETKTAAALDECAASSEEAVHDVLERSA